MKTKLIRIGLLLVLLVSFCAIPSRTYAKAFTETYRLEDQVIIVNAGNSCSGAMVGTLTYDALIHLTENKNGFHSVLNMKGTAIVEPVDPQYPSYTGDFSEIIVEHVTKNQDFFIHVVTQLDENLAFHITFKMSYDDGYPSIDVFNTVCGP